MKKDDLLDNRYKILEKLGEGGMGEVYKAYDQVLGKNVAIKTLLPKIFSDERAADQFRKEVNLTQNLRHDNITAIYDLKFSEEIPFIVMEYVEGQVLSNFIYRQPEHRFDESTFLELANQILNGVEHAHKKGTIHRDLKSNNIMITDDGEVKIMDFGIAASLKETYSKSTGTPTTLSIHYASPEQINGEEPSESMDIYSLGCVFYEMLDGEPPFRKGDILHQQLTKKPEPMKHISAHLNSVILKCLEKRKEDRFESVDELKAALCGKDVDVTVKIPKVKKKKAKPIPEKRRIPLFMKAVVIILFIMLSTVGYFLIENISKKKPGIGSETQIVQKKLVPEPKDEPVEKQKPIPVQKGELRIGSNPPGATIFINGAQRGTTPLTLSLKFGKYKIRINNYGYEDINEQVVINSREGVNRNYDLALIPKEGTLVVDSDPSGASISIDGITRGKTPSTLLLDRGKYKVKIAIQNYKEVNDQVEINTNQSTYKKYKLKPLTWSNNFSPGPSKLATSGQAFSIEQTTDKGFIIAGYIIKNNSQDVYLVKTDPFGEKEWEKTYGGSRKDLGLSVQQTTDGGFVIVGHTLLLSGETNVYMIKTDVSGVREWEKTYGGSRSFFGKSVDQTTDGGFIIAGYTRYMYTCDIYLLKIDALGRMEWEKTFDKLQYDYGNSVKQTTDGGFVIVGDITDRYRRDRDVYLIKTSTNGDIEWEKTYDGSGNLVGESVEQIQDGGFIIVGSTNSLGSLYRDVYVMKTGVRGRMEWEKTFGGSRDDRGESVRQTKDGGFVIAGSYEHIDNIDVYLIKINGLGEKEWEEMIGGSNDDYGLSVQQTTDGGFIIAGYSGIRRSKSDSSYLIGGHRWKLFSIFYYTKYDK